MTDLIFSTLEVEPPPRRRILVIEDNAHVRYALRCLLENAGYQVNEASDGLDGIERFRAAPADLIITDILMPKMAGSTVISQLRREFPHLKVIAISGGGGAYCASDYLCFARELGAQYTLLKPFRHAELLNAVREVLA